jgi:hypothetical protein
MGKIAADTNPLAKTIERGAIGASLIYAVAGVVTGLLANTSDWRSGRLPAAGWRRH